MYILSLKLLTRMRDWSFVKPKENIKSFVSETLVYHKSLYGFDNFEMLSVIIINLMT